MKGYFKSKTVWLGFAVAMLGAVEGLMRDAPMDQSYGGIVMAAIGAAIIGLRSITTQPLSEK